MNLKLKIILAIPVVLLLLLRFFLATVFLFISNIFKAVSMLIIGEYEEFKFIIRNYFLY